MRQQHKHIRDPVERRAQRQDAHRAPHPLDLVPPQRDAHRDVAPGEPRVEDDALRGDVDEAEGAGHGRGGEDAPESAADEADAGEAREDVDGGLDEGHGCGVLGGLTDCLGAIGLGRCRDGLWVSWYP